MTTTTLNIFARPIIRAKSRNSKPLRRSPWREAADLLSMEDWMLNDIGITHADALREARRLQWNAASKWMDSMATISHSLLSFGWIAAAMQSIRLSRREKRQDRFELIAERELRLNNHMFKDIGLTTNDVKGALSASRSWL